jgi:hypothetical protein
MKLRLLGIVIISLLLLSSSRAAAGGKAYIVNLKKGQSIDAINNAYGTKTVRSIPNTSTYLIKAADDDGSNAILQDLQSDKGVESAEADSHVRLHTNQR